MYGKAESFMKTFELPAEWKALWISPERHDPEQNERVRASYLQRSFEYVPDGRPVELYITAHGIYNAWINGCPVQEAVLAPFVSQYDKRLQVQRADVTGLLREGGNRILVSLGDGLWRGSMGNAMTRQNFERDAALFAELRCGDETLLATDGSWEATQKGPLGLNDPMIGEEYDARREDLTDGYGIAAAEWHPVRVKKHLSLRNLIAQETPEIVETERFAATLLTTPAGETVLDFGVNLAGYVELHIPAGVCFPGEPLVLLHGETLDENGNFTQENFQNPRGEYRCEQTVKYWCREGENAYKPTKCYFGFRYVKVESTLKIDPAWFTAVAVCSDMAVTAGFTCGNDDVNKLVANTFRSMRSNFVGQPTDCPTRERSGFTGDAQVFCDTALYLMDSAPVLRGWLKDVAASAYRSGKLRQWAPVMPGCSMGMLDGVSGWCDAIVLVPWRIWKRTGDLGAAEESYGAMKGWIDWLMKRNRLTRPENLARVPKELRPYFADQGFQWGEWLEPDAPADYAAKQALHGDPEVATAYLSYSARALSELAEALGHAEDAAKYAEIADKAREAYRAVFLEDGRVYSDRQCRYVRPLFMGLLDEFEIPRAAQDLMLNVRHREDHPNTGFLSTAELLRVLSDNGYADCAYDLLLQEDRPGWLYAVKKGATSVWETWNGIDEAGRPSASLNHYALGGVCGWLMDSAAGIRVERGAVTLAPKTDPRLGSVTAWYESALGRVESAWSYEGKKLVLRFCVPKDVTAKVILPDGREEEISGKKEFKLAL